MLTVERQQTPEEVYRWLRDKAMAQNIAAKVYEERARKEDKLLIIPVFIAGDLDAFEFASQLQDLEDAWNN